LANKFEFDFNSPAQSGELIGKLQTQIDALKQWARMVEARQLQLQEGLLTMVANFESLASLLVNNQEISEQAITDGRDEFLKKVRDLQEQALAQKKTQLWTPDGNPVVN
jgi:hypothetical protein